MIFSSSKSNWYQPARKTARVDMSVSPRCQARHRGTTRSFWKRALNGRANTACSQHGGGGGRGHNGGVWAEMFGLVWFRRPAGQATRPAQDKGGVGEKGGGVKPPKAETKAPYHAGRTR